MTGLAWLSVVLSALAAAAVVREGVRFPASAPQAATQDRPSSTRDGSVPVRAGVAALVGLGTALLLGGRLGVVIGMVATGMTWSALARAEPRASRRRREQLEAALPQVVDLMASSLAVGLSPTAALRRVAEAVGSPMRDELMTLDAKLLLGVDPTTVWRELAAHPQLGALGRCIARAADSGGSVADAMHRLADDLRGNMRGEMESRARAVGVRAAVPLGLCLLPAFVLVGVVPLVAGSVALFTGG